MLVTSTPKKLASRIVIYVKVIESTIKQKIKVKFSLGSFLAATKKSSSDVENVNYLT